MSSPVSSKMQAASALDEPVEAAADRGVRGDAAGAVGAAANRADDELVSAIGTGDLLCELRRASCCTISRPAFSVRVVPPDCWITSRSTGRPLACNRAAQLLAIEAFAAQRDEQHGADIRVRAQPLHHLERILVRIAAGEADQVDVVGAGLLHDEPRDVMRALDEVGDGDDVADALAAVLAKKSSHGRGAFISVRPSAVRVWSRGCSRCAGCAGARARRAPTADFHRADRCSVFEDASIGRKGASRELVAQLDGRRAWSNVSPSISTRSPAGDVAARDEDVVVRMQQQQRAAVCPSRSVVRGHRDFSAGWSNHRGRRCRFGGGLVLPFLFELEDGILDVAVRDHVFAALQPGIAHERIAVVARLELRVEVEQAGAQVEHVDRADEVARTVVLQVVHGMRELVRDAGEAVAHASRVRAAAA